MKMGEMTEAFYTPPVVDLSNTFDVVERTNGNGSVDTLFNWNVSCGVVGMEDVPDGYRQYYEVKSGDHLKLISYALYGTIDFWWVIAKVNGIEDVLEPLVPGTRLVTFPEPTMGAIYSEVLRLSKDTDTKDA